MKDKVKEALETISTVNGNLFTPLVLSDDEQNPNVHVRVLEKDSSVSLELYPNDEGKTATLLREYVLEALERAQIKCNASQETITIRKGRSNATTKKTHSDGVQDRDDHRITRDSDSD